MFWGWPGILIMVLHAASAITAYKGPEDRLSKFLVAIAEPNLWLIAKAG